MQTVKKWVRDSNTIFSLWDNNQQIGTMEIALGTMVRMATAQFGNRKIIIKKTGFWKNHLEITDSNGQLIARAYPEKWYAHSYILETDNKKFKLLIRNNPLAEWALQDNNKDMLAYGLGIQEGKPIVKITTASAATNYLFDFILWYLFLPIATEQSADDLTFLMLIA